MDNTNNKEFWDDYVDYFENKIREANGDSIAEDKTTSDVLYEEYFELLNIDSEDKILDFGCGFCRLYPIYKKRTNNIINRGYYGLDISERELKIAEGNHSDLKIGKSLFEFDGLHIPFDDAFFDKIICFGVFDACDQEKIIKELFRVLKTNGVLFISGKNNNYFEDDKAAIVAEVNARKKGFPNHFTDVHNFTQQLLEHNVKLLNTFYFLRRCGFLLDQAVLEMPEIFYEWIYLIQKTTEYKCSDYKKFSEKYSKKFC